MDEAKSQRFAADCRLMPSEKNCSLYVEGTKDEVLKVSIAHAVADHGHTDTPEFRAEVESFIKPL